MSGSDSPPSRHVTLRRRRPPSLADMILHRPTPTRSPFTVPARQESLENSSGDAEDADFAQTGDLSAQVCDRIISMPSSAAVRCMGYNAAALHAATPGSERSHPALATAGMNM